MAKFKKNVKEEVQDPVEIAEGVMRDAGAENPLEDNPVEQAPRKAGNWIKVTREELESYELAGKLIGYDPSTGEALLK